MTDNEAEEIKSIIEYLRVLHTEVDEQEYKTALLLSIRYLKKYMTVLAIIDKYRKGADE